MISIGSSSSNLDTGGLRSLQITNSIGILEHLNKGGPAKGDEGQLKL